MKPEFTRIISYINKQYAIVEVSGPQTRDIRRFICETRLISEEVKRDFKRGSH